MEKPVKGFLIDPEKRIVKPVRFQSGNLGDIYKLIRAQCFDIATVAPGTIIFVDDQGMFFKNRYMFKHTGYTQPLCGYGLVAGVDIHGETVDAPCTIEELTSELQFGRNPHPDANWTLDK